MRISCLGASREVGRSGFLLEEKNTRILLDYGVKLLHDGLDFPLPVKGYIDGIILSHAHLDHCGALPALFRKSECPVFITPPTIPITQILLQDCLKIAEEEGNVIPYDENNVINYLRNCRPTKYKKTKNIGTDIKFELMDAGHILGAAFALIYGKKYKVAYTGDIKLEDTEMHKGAKWPKQKFHVLMTETTYNTDHPSRKELQKEFIDACKEALNKNMPVLCPAFALGRSQELLTLFQKHKNLDVPVYLDGMSQRISEVYVDFLNYIKEGNTLMGALNKAIWVTNSFMRKDALKKPSIVITTSGMLSGGPINDYLLKLRGKKAAIFLSGYQVKGTPGRNLLETGRFVSREKSLNLSNCIIKKFDFSAHAGVTELKTIAKRSSPNLILAVHGDEEKSQSYKQQVEEELGIEVLFPKLGQKIDVEEHI